MNERMNQDERKDAMVKEAMIKDKGLAGAVPDAGRRRNCPPIRQAFSGRGKGRKTLIGFLMAGDPDLPCSGEYIQVLEKAGIDLIEIGIPFSDPVAEGEVISRADQRALAAGASIGRVFELAASIRCRTEIPMVFLTYINPVFSYGYERFLRQCAEAGIAGLIIPDLPFEEQGEITPFAQRYGIDLITMVSPASCGRVRLLAEKAEGFVYLVSSLGVTGERENFHHGLGDLAAQIREVTDTPLAVGFGITTPGQAREIAALADGVIIGSAIVSIIEQYGREAHHALADFAAELREAVDSLPVAPAIDSKDIGSLPADLKEELP